MKKNTKDDIVNIINFLKNITTWKQIDNKNNISSLSDNSSYRINHYLKNISILLSITIPNMVINNVDLLNNVPKYWNLSEEHNEKISNYMSEYFNKFSKFYHSKFTSLLNNIEQKCRNLLIFQSLLPCYSDIIISEDKKIKSVLNCETNILIHHFCFLNVIKQHILLADEDYSNKIKNLS